MCDATLEIDGIWLSKGSMSSLVRAGGILVRTLACPVAEQARDRLRAARAGSSRSTAPARPRSPSGGGYRCVAPS